KLSGVGMVPASYPDRRTPADPARRSTGSACAGGRGAAVRVHHSLTAGHHAVHRLGEFRGRHVHRGGGTVLDPRTAPVPRRCRLAARLPRSRWRPRRGHRGPTTGTRRSRPCHLAGTTGDLARPAARTTVRTGLAHRPRRGGV